MIRAINNLNFGHKEYKLIGEDGKPYKSSIPGKLGGNKSLKIYGRLDCPNALKWISKGHYVKNRVFFKDEITAIKAGYRPCGICLKSKYEQWKKDSETFKNNKLSVLV